MTILYEYIAYYSILLLHNRQQRTPVCQFSRVVVAAIQSTRPASHMIPSRSGIPTSPASSMATRAPPIEVATRAPIAATTIRSTIPATSMPAEVPMQAAFTGTARPGRTTSRFGPRSECRRSRDRSIGGPAGSPATACHPRSSDAVGIAKPEESRRISTTRVSSTVGLSRWWMASWSGLSPEEKPSALTSFHNFVKLGNAEIYLK